MRTVMESVGVEKLASELKKIRIARKLTQAKLAEMVGMKQSHISMIERGLRVPTLDVLITLCIVLDAELCIVAHKSK